MIKPELSFTALLEQVRNCRICQAELPCPPRPVLQAHPAASILIAGQAPGKKVQQTGIPFDDPSGDRLRQWLGITAEIFYDPKKIAILPMGFCYPGTGKSGDLPPRPECLPAWRAQLMAGLSNIQLTIVLGLYAQNYHLSPRPSSLTQSVKAWQDYWPSLLPLPHPSPRNNLWLKRNTWFEQEVIPVLKCRVAELLNR